MSKEEYDDWGRSIADDIRQAASEGASVGELLALYEDSCFDGDILDYL